MISKKGDYTDISFVGTTGQLKKVIYTVGSAAKDVGVSHVIRVHEVTLSNPTATSGIIKLYSDIGTVGGGNPSFRVYSPTVQTVHFSKEIPVEWILIGTSGRKKYVYASAFAGAGVNTIIGAIKQ